MTITLRPEQEKAIQHAIDAGVIHSLDELIESAIATLPRHEHPAGHRSRSEAVRRMKEFGDKHRLNPGEPITRNLLHEGHRR